MTEQTPAPPASVRLAINLLYGVLGIAIVRMLWTVINHIEVRSPDMILLNAFIVYAVFCFLVLKLKQQKAWARIGIVAVFIISIPLAVIPAFQSFGHSPVVNGLGMVQLVIYLLALLKLFQPESSNWLRQQ